MPHSSKYYRNFLASARAVCSYRDLSTKHVVSQHTERDQQLSTPLVIPKPKPFPVSYIPPAESVLANFCPAITEADGEIVRAFAARARLRKNFYYICIFPLFVAQTLRGESLTKNGSDRLCPTLSAHVWGIWMLWKRAPVAEAAESIAPMKFAIFISPLCLCALLRHINPLFVHA